MVMEANGAHRRPHLLYCRRHRPLNGSSRSLINGDQVEDQKPVQGEYDILGLKKGYLFQHELLVGFEPLQYR